MAKQPSTTTITRDDWLAAIAEVTTPQVDPVDPAVVTYDELAETLKIAKGTARKRLRDLVAAGRAKQVVKRVLCGDGKVRSMTAFRLLKK